MNDKDKSRGEMVKKLIQSIVEYLTQHDKKELLVFLVDEHILDSILELEEIVDVYLLEEGIHRKRSNNGKGWW